VIVGVFLPWLDTGGVTVGANSVTGEPGGIDLTYGIVALVAGIVAVVLALLMLIWPGPTRLWGLLTLLAGAVALAMGVLTLTTVRDVYVSFVGSEIGEATPEVANSLRALFDNGGLAEDVALGTYLAIAGGGVALLGGLAAILKRRPRSVETESVLETQHAPEALMDPAAPAGPPQTEAAPVATDTEPMVDQGDAVSPGEAQREPETQTSSGTLPEPPSDTGQPGASGRSEQPGEHPGDVDDWR